MKPKSLVWTFEKKCIRCTSHKLNVDGYLMLQRKGRYITIPRIILEKRGQLTPGIVARHTCDHPWCINPDHIVPGTPADNMHDRDSRGRNKSPKGVQHGLAKLSESDVISIRESNETQQAIADRYGIARQHVSKIRNREIWRHLP